MKLQTLTNEVTNTYKGSYKQVQTKLQTKLQTLTNEVTNRCRQGYKRSYKHLQKELQALANTYKQNLQTENRFRELNTILTNYTVISAKWFVRLLVTWVTVFCWVTDWVTRSQIPWVTDYKLPKMYSLLYHVYYRVIFWKLYF